MRVFLSPSSTVTQFEGVRTCLNTFVHNFIVIYGPQHVVFNVHNLVHLADDCIYFNGPLDTISPFPFENYLGKIKKLLRGTRRLIAQLYKRLAEIYHQESLIRVE